MEEAVRLITALWTGKRTTFHGKYFRAEDAILEPKPVQQPHPPIMIGGGGEQLTLRAVARLAGACNVGGTPDLVRHKYEVLRRHCETEHRNYEEIERTNITSFVLARDEAALAAKRRALAVPAQFYGFAGTVSQVTDLIGQYRDAGVQLLISSAYKNDAETLELLAADVMPVFRAITLFVPSPIPRRGGGGVSRRRRGHGPQPLCRDLAQYSAVRQSRSGTSHCLRRLVIGRCPVACPQ
jgi:alkanesulfonate monooxygenase SsuD/methylene tetrahydromethanopterin reductase-like flavin-dependent oxidoreductase (luciferase family)